MNSARWHCLGGVRSFETKHGMVLATSSKDHADAIIPSQIEIEHLYGLNFDYLARAGVIGPLKANTPNPMLPHRKN
jgi:hypothetical protein